jgi:hypothetical protein
MILQIFTKNGTLVELGQDAAPEADFNNLAQIITAIRATGYFMLPTFYIAQENIAFIGVRTDGGAANFNFSPVTGKPN